METSKKISPTELDYIKERDQLAHILENSLNEIYVFDAHSLHFLYLNKGALKNMGFSSGEIQKLTPVDIKPKYTLSQFHELIHPLIAEEIEELVFETIHLRKDGSNYDVEVHLQKTSYHGKEALVAIITDITEINRHRLLLKEANKKLQERNEALDEFAHVAAHDLQEPLRLIKNFSDILKKKYDDLIDERGKKYLYHLSDASLRMSILIKELLAFSLVGRDNLSTDAVNLDKVLMDVYTDLSEKLAQTNGALILPENTNITFLGSASGIYRVMLNLINNALKFIAPETAPHIVVDISQNQTECFVSVQDNGIGMEKEVFSEIFKPFKRVYSKDVYEGSGLGLATCKKIIHNHGGKIWVESMPGKGSTFHFSLQKANV